MGNGHGRITKKANSGSKKSSMQHGGQPSANGTLLSGHSSAYKFGHERRQSLQVRARKYGLPIAALCAPGECQFNDQWTEVPLLERYANHHDTMILTFGLPDASQPLKLPTCACILARFVPSASSDEVVRPYTPISTNAMVGRFQVLVKIYEQGAMTQHLRSLAVGATLQFKHTASNVKIQYPFGKQHVAMLAGGSGITPMVQALHAILGTSDDNTKVSMILCNKTQDDIICEGLLQTWMELYPERLRVLHWISRGDDRSVEQGHIDRQTIDAHCAPASEDVLVMVCGPPSMYDALCGPRESVQLSGLLQDMGYAPEQVVKF